jgi:hypothetical protein
MNQPTIHQQFIKGEFVELVELSTFEALKTRYLATFKAADVLLQAFDVLTAPEVVQASWGGNSMRHRMEAQQAYKNAKDDLLNILFPKEA